MSDIFEINTYFDRPALNITSRAATAYDTQEIMKRMRQEEQAPHSAYNEINNFLYILHQQRVLAGRMPPWST